MDKVCSSKRDVAFPSSPPTVCYVPSFINPLVIPHRHSTEGTGSLGGGTSSSAFSVELKSVLCWGYFLTLVPWQGQDPRGLGEGLPVHLAGDAELHQDAPHHRPGLEQDRKTRPQHTRHSCCQSRRHFLFSLSCRSEVVSLEHIGSRLKWVCSFYVYVKQRENAMSVL